MTKLTIKEMQKIAKKRGGKCLSHRYINSRTKMKWQCKMGHQWFAIPDSVKRGFWCKRCSMLNVWRIRKNKNNKISQKFLYNST